MKKFLSILITFAFLVGSNVDGLSAQCTEYDYCHAIGTSVQNPNNPGFGSNHPGGLVISNFEKDLISVYQVVTATNSNDMLSIAGIHKVVVAFQDFGSYIGTEVIINDNITPVNSAHTYRAPQGSKSNPGSYRTEFDFNGHSLMIQPSTVLNCTEATIQIEEGRLFKFLNPSGQGISSETVPNVYFASANGPYAKLIPSATPYVNSQANWIFSVGDDEIGFYSRINSKIYEYHLPNTCWNTCNITACRVDPNTDLPVNDGVVSLGEWSLNSNGVWCALASYDNGYGVIKQEVVYGDFENVPCNTPVITQVDCHEVVDEKITWHWLVGKFEVGRLEQDMLHLGSNNGMQGSIIGSPVDTLIDGAERRTFKVQSSNGTMYDVCVIFDLYEVIHPVNGHGGSSFWVYTCNQIFQYCKITVNPLNGSSSIVNITVPSTQTPHTQTYTVSCDDVVTFDNSQVTIYLTNPVTNASCGTNNGSIDISVSGGTGSYSYLWSNGQSTQDIYSLAQGQYGVTVTDTHSNCSSSATYDVGSTDAITIYLTNPVTNASCGTNNGSIDISVSGGTGSYSYLWSNGQSTEDIYSLAQGQYSVTVTDANGCSETSSYEVEGTQVGTLDINTTPISCTGNGSANVNTNISNPTYSWTGPNGFVSNNASISVSIEGTYFASVTDINGCTVSGQVYVSSTTGPTITLVNTGNAGCQNNEGFINIQASGGSAPYTYSWSNGGNSATITGLSAGTYTVVVTDANGCQNSTIYTINSDTNGVTVVGVPNNATCGENNGSASVVNGVQYDSITWTYPDGTSIIASSISNLAPGTYTVTVVKNGCSASDTITIGTSSDISTVINSTNPTCTNSNGVATAQVTGGSGSYTYFWSNGGTNATIVGLSSGSYFLTVTDNQTGCSTDGFIILVPISDPNDQDCDGLPSGIDCNDGNPSIGAPGDSCDDGNSDTVMDQIQDDCTCAGTEINPCINSNISLILTSSATSCGLNNGLLSVVITGGVSPYTYIAVGNGVSFVTTSDNVSNSFANLGSDTYEVIVEDANGCTVAKFIDVEQSTGVEVLLFDNDATCTDTDGSIDVTVNGTSPYVYIITNADGFYQESQVNSDFTIDGLLSGEYTVHITDSNGCEFEQNQNVGSFAGTLPEITGVPDDVTIFHPCQIEQYLLPAVIATGGSIVIQEGERFDMDDQIIFTWTAINTCGSVIDEFIITKEYAVIDEVSSNTSISQPTCGNADGSIEVVMIPENLDYDYQWNTGETTSTINSLTGGSTYVVEVKLDDCLVGTQTFELEDPQPTEIDEENIQISNNDCENSYDVDLSGFPEIDDLVWSDGSLALVRTNLTETLECEVVFENGCTATLFFEYEAINPFDATFNEASTISELACYGDANGTIVLDVIGGSGEYSYEWENIISDSNVATKLSAGTYKVTVFDSRGCSKELESEVTEPELLPTPVPTSITSAQCLVSPATNGAIEFDIPSGLNLLKNGREVTLLELQDVPEGDMSMYMYTNDNGCTSEAMVVEMSCQGCKGFPNPVATGGQFTFEVNFGEGDFNANITVNDMRGKVMQTFSNQSVVDGKVTLVFNANFPSGMYFVIASGGEFEQGIGTMMNVIE